jgi:hypothetical protein
MSKRIRTRLAVAAAAIGMSAAVVPAPAQASAGGYQYWGATPFALKGVTIPSGQLYHYISGSGLRINWEAANFASAGNLCDSAVKFTYGYGSQYFWSNTSYGCTRAHQWKYTLNRTVPRGKACAELWVYGGRKYLTKQCHFVS